VDAVITYSGTPDNPDYPVGKRSRWRLRQHAGRRL